MTQRGCHIIVFAAVIAVHFANTVRATDGGCHHCGCLEGCKKVCRLVREDKKVTVTCWGCKCEDFCAPGKSHRGCKNVEGICEDCDPSVCNQSKDFVWYDWEPGCSKQIYTKKKLMKKTVTKKVPSFKWVVEDMCQECQDTCPCALIPPDATVPLPPAIADARYLSGITLPKSESDTVPSQLLLK